MAKPEWGTKRICLSCGARFYDLQRDPIICPSCGTTHDPQAQARPRRSRAVAPPKLVAVPEEEPALESAGADEEELGVEEEGDEEDAEAVVKDSDEDDDEEDADNAIEDVSELGDDDDVSDVIETDIDEDERGR